MSVTKNSGPADPRMIFSAKAIREAEGDEKISEKRAVELNELAKQVAELFSSDAVSPFMISGMVRIIEFLGLLAISLAVSFVYLPGEERFSFTYIGASFLGAFLAVCFTQAVDGLSGQFTAQLCQPDIRW
ncbi:MAG: hypothetical protein R3D29_07840 [Nitratireductor sp.]